MSAKAASAEAIGRVHRGLAALIGALLAAPAALSLDPFGIYMPEERLGTIALGGLLGGVLGAALAGFLRRPGRRGTVLGLGLFAATGIATHSAGIAVMFSLAVDRRVLFVALGLAAVLAIGALAARLRLAEALILGLLPPILLCNIQQARFLRDPGVDCAPLMRADGVTAIAPWPDPGHPALQRSLLYDVVADEDDGVVMAAFIRQRSDVVGCGVIGAWGPDGEAAVLEEPFVREGGPCFMTARLLLDRERDVLWLPLSSYDGALPPRLQSWRYAVVDGRLTFERLHDGPLVLDPSDLRLDGDRLVVLSYPRRFEKNGASRLALIETADPRAPQVVAQADFEPDGWMTEYLVVQGDVIYVSDVFGHFYEVRTSDLRVLREVKPDASTLGMAVWKDHLFVAAPYRRELLVMDRSSLEVVGALPAGNAMREVALDGRAGRVFATAYGDGVLHGWQIGGDGALTPLGRGGIELGSPMRGVHVLPRSGDVVVGGACGVFRLDPARAFGSAL